MRPYSALADRTPEEFARAWQALSSASERTAGPAHHALAEAALGPEAADAKLVALFGSPRLEMKARPKSWS